MRWVPPANITAMRNKTLILAAVLTGVMGPAAGKCESAETAGRAGATERDRKTITVGFSQIGAESGWRTAETKSVRSEADRRGIRLKFSDPQKRQADHSN